MNRRTLIRGAIALVMTACGAFTSSGNGVSSGLDAGTDGSPANLLGSCDGGPHRFVFVTSQAFNGDLGGQDGANALCASAAANGKLGGTYVAWVSTVKTPPQLLAKQGVALVRPGTCAMLAPDLATLEAFGPALPLNVTELGLPVNGGGPNCPVWTATNPDGTVHAPGENPTFVTCTDWTASGDAGQGLVGDCLAATDAGWSINALLNCDAHAGRLFCFQN